MGIVKDRPGITIQKPSDLIAGIKIDPKLTITIKLSGPAKLVINNGFITYNPK